MSTDRLAVNLGGHPPSIHRLASFAAAVAGVLLWVAWLATWQQVQLDVHAYFVADTRHPYGLPVGARDAYLYSPAFTQLIEPLRHLGYEPFAAIWRGAQLAVLVAFLGPFVAPAIFIAPVAMEVFSGNIHLLLAAAVVAGFRWPATWAFVLLTKVTPGVGLLWFVVRREWRALEIALGLTAAIAAVSFAWSPSSWFEWFGLLAGRNGSESVPSFITAPLWTRLIGAASLVAWGARTDRRWTVLVAGWIALPVSRDISIAMLTGVPVLAGLRWWEVFRRHQPARIRGAETPARTITVIG